MKSSCMNCTDRVLGCHSHCERYARYKEEVNRINKASKNDRMVYGVLCKSIERATKLKYEK